MEPPREDSTEPPPALPPKTKPREHHGSSPAVNGLTPEEEQPSTSSQIPLPPLPIVPPRAKKDKVCVMQIVLHFICATFIYPLNATHKVKP